MRFLMADLSETRVVLEQVREHLVATSSFQTPIEVFLSRSIVMTLCAELERTVEGLIFARIETNDDEEIIAFSKTVARIVRNIKPGEVADVLGRFGTDCKQRYREALVGSIGEAGLGRIGNLVVVRDSFAHLKPPDVTFRDAEQAYGDGLALVASVRTALGL